MTLSLKRKLNSTLGLTALLLMSHVAGAQDMDDDMGTGTPGTTGQTSEDLVGVGEVEPLDDANVTTQSQSFRSGSMNGSMRMENRTSTSGMRSGSSMQTRRVYRTVRTYRTVPVYRSGRAVSSRRVYSTRRMYRTVPVRAMTSNTRARRSYARTGA